MDSGRGHEKNCSDCNAIAWLLRYCLLPYSAVGGHIK
jgi:hypothetical protein